MLLTKTSLYISITCVNASKSASDLASHHAQKYDAAIWYLAIRGVIERASLRCTDVVPKLLMNWQACRRDVAIAHISRTGW